MLSREFGLEKTRKKKLVDLSCLCEYMHLHRRTWTAHWAPADVQDHLTACAMHKRAGRGPSPLPTAGGHCNLGCYGNCTNPQTTKTADGFRPPPKVLSAMLENARCHVGTTFSQLSCFCRYSLVPEVRHHAPAPFSASSLSSSVCCQTSTTAYTGAVSDHTDRGAWRCGGCSEPHVADGRQQAQHRPWGLAVWPRGLRPSGQSHSLPSTSCYQPSHVE